MKEIIKDIIDQGDMPGMSKIECGNYANLNVNLAKEELKDYYEYNFSVNALINKGRI